MKKAVIYLAVSLSLSFLLSGCYCPSSPNSHVIRYEVTSSPIGSGEYLTRMDKITYMAGADLKPTIVNGPALPWQAITTMPDHWTAQLNAMCLQAENSVADNSQITITIYKDSVIFRTQTYVGRQITDAASMILEGTIY